MLFSRVFLDAVLSSQDKGQHSHNACTYVTLFGCACSYVSSYLHLWGKHSRIEHTCSVLGLHAFAYESSNCSFDELYNHTGYISVISTQCDEACVSSNRLNWLKHNYYIDSICVAFHHCVLPPCASSIQVCCEMRKCIGCIGLTFLFYVSFYDNTEHSHS